MPNDEYRVVFVPWYTDTGKASVEQIAIFSELEQISDWIELCRTQGIRINIEALDHCLVERTSWESMEAELLYMQRRTGQVGIPTVQINLQSRKEH